MAEEKLNYKIVLSDVDTITNKQGDIDLSVFDEFGRVVMTDYAERDKLREELKDADAVFLNKTVVNKDLLGDNPRLKFISLFATGYNNIDLDYCREKGITVCNVPTYSSNAVAQHTFAFILEHYSNVAKFNGLIHENGWIEKGTATPFEFPQNEVFGKTIGLIGYGKIGHQVAKLARAFGMDVLVYTRTYGRAKELGNTDLDGFIDRAEKDVTFVTLDNLLKHSDIVSVHCPLNDDSRGMINAELISKMRKGAFFINTSRGPIVNEKDLKDALVLGKLSGAALDVIEVEPMTADCPLLTAPNLIMTPHIAWSPIETRQRLIKEEIKNYKAFLAGNPVNVVS